MKNDTNDSAAERSAAAASPEKNVQNLVMLCHLLALFGFIVPIGSNVIGPLVLWLLYKDKHPEVDRAGREAVNFQINITIGIIVSLMLAPIVIGLLLLAIVTIFNLVMIVTAAVKTREGEEFRYQLGFRFLR